MTENEFEELTRHFGARIYHQEKETPTLLDTFSSFCGAAVVVLAIVGLWL